MIDSISEERKKVSKTGHIKRSDDLIAQLSKPNVAAQKRSAKPGITWDEVLLVDTWKRCALEWFGMKMLTKGTAIEANRVFSNA